MKHLKSITEFSRVDEQLFGDDYQRFINLLGFGDKKIEKTEKSPVSGNVVSNVSGNKQENIDALVKAMKRHNITNPFTQIAILGVIGKETGYVPRNEIGYGSTSNDRIRGIFGSRVKGLSDSELTALKSNDTKFFDRVYGPDDPSGNGKKYGNTQAGDGYKYRGRGFNGITFKSGYENMQKLLDQNSKLDKKVNIVSSPDSLNDVDVAAEVAVLYFLQQAENPAMKQKYGVSDINGFKDQDTATKAMANANAGWGYNLDRDYLNTFAKAKEQASKFKIEDFTKSDIA